MSLSPDARPGIPGASPQPDQPGYGSHPELKPVVDIVDITLKTRLKDIPKPDPCEVCGHPTKKIFLKHDITGTDVRIQTSRVPGYICKDPECGIAALSIEGFVEALTMASEILIGRGDNATAAAFGRRIEIENRLMAQQTPPAQPQIAPDAL